MPLSPELLAAVADQTGPVNAQPAGGASHCFKLVNSAGDAWFLKIGPVSSLSIFEAERDGLHALRAPGFIRVPDVVAVATAGQSAFILLEFIEFGAKTSTAAAELGGQLASLHQTGNDAFGWVRDNNIGPTRQLNTKTTDWASFWRDQRLLVQLRLAADNGAGRAFIARGESLLGRIDGFFGDHRPVPSLLHGDFWGGNWGVTPAGEPVIFDPATYFGDRETDIAMTELFGGFQNAFYMAYKEAWPLSAGYEFRRDLYNLYHVLNHFNLFGGGYLDQADSLISKLSSS